MSSGARIQLLSSGHESHAVPVKVEIFDQSFRPVQQDWQLGSAGKVYPLDPGTYGVRASVSSGKVFQAMLQVKAGEIADCALPIYQASPHESHEWAYLTRPLNKPGKETFDSPRYAGLWLRVWHRDRHGSWNIGPLFHVGDTIDAAADGVNYRFRDSRDGLFALQVGGTGVPWKFVVLPTSYEVMALLRPSSMPETDEYPLDMVVSSDDLEMESLLTFLRRGDLAQAESMVDPAEYAERLLYQKVVNTAAAAVGGYFLLRANDLDRLHNWANNLDYWFEWMADGPIIHAWQIIAEVRSRPDSDKGRLRDARERLLEAVKRGIPIYTEGLRLLRDGLLLFDRAAEGGDEEVSSALQTIGAYTAVADWSATTTSFTGAQPDDPSSESSLGQPESTAECVYVYDVPLDQVINRGLMAPGEEIYTVVGDTRHTATVRENGLLIYGGRPYTCLGDLHKAVTGTADDAWTMWVVSSTNGRLFDLCEGLRRPA